MAVGARLIAQAFAKVSGSYQALKGGYAYEALMDLTGADCSLTYTWSPTGLVTHWPSGYMFMPLLHQFGAARTHGRHAIDQAGRRGAAHRGALGSAGRARPQGQHS